MNSPPDAGDHPAHILIVDDERQNRRVLEVMLKAEGFDVLTAAGGQEALGIVARQPPDLILLDISMPEMDGYQVAARIKNNIATKNIPVIMVTGLDDREARMLGLSAGAEDFLSKPVDRAELCVRIRNLLRLKAYADYHGRHSQMLESEVASRTADLIDRTKTLERQTAVLREQAALLDLARDAIIVQDMHSLVLFWNRGAEVMYGWLSKEAVGQPAYKLLKSEFSEPREQIEATLLLHGQWEGEAIHHKRDGTRLIVASRWALQRDADNASHRIGPGSVILTIDNDITDRKQGDRDLLSLTERLWLATAVAKVGVWEWDLASNMLTWDATMFDIYRLPPLFPMPYQQWSAMVHPEDWAAVEATSQRVIDEKGQGSVEFRVVLTDGSIRSISAVERVVLDGSANASRLIGVNMDVTERKEAEEAMERSRSDQIRFKDEFLSHVSHELRSPLTAIRQFTSILLSGSAGELNREQREYQQIVQKNGRQLHSMIDDLLEITRLETGTLTVELESVAVAEAVDDTFNTLQVTARAKGVTLSCCLTEDLPEAEADPTRLRQILILLVDNAIKFTPGGGAVSIQARLLAQNRHMLLIEVSDSGCGISPELTERIFERLYQVSDHPAPSRRGLGLGLYICKELVTRQGGKIWVESQSQKGSTFSFTIPVFSLNHLIAPLLRNEKWPSESVAVVMVQTCLSDGWSSKEPQEEWSREARSLLQRCLLPDLDVLLPRTRLDVEGDRFFVAAFADEKGAGVLVSRIREQFKRRLSVKQTGLTISVSYRMLEPVPPEIGASMENILTSMATRLEESIKSRIISEAAHYHE